MNLLIVEKVEEEYQFFPDDPRFEAIQRIREPVLRLGVINGRRAEAICSEKSDRALTVRVRKWETQQPRPPEIHLILGYPRPAEARRILAQAAELAVTSLTFVEWERTNPGYSTSSVWQESQIHRLLVQGLSQGFHTHLPAVFLLKNGEQAIEAACNRSRVTVLDPYMGTGLLADTDTAPDFPGAVVLGSERGFSPEEQKRLRHMDVVQLRHLGSSILRTETAVVAAITLAHRQTGYLRDAGGAVLRNEDTRF